MIKYKIITEKDPDIFASRIEKALEDNWDFYGDLHIVKDGEWPIYIRELFKTVNPSPTPKDYSNFKEYYEEIDQEIKDLLQINQIALECVNGELFTTVGDKIIRGIDALTILNLLKNSAHVPLGLSESKVIEEINKFLCRF